MKKKAAASLTRTIRTATLQQYIDTIEEMRLELIKERETIAQLSENQSRNLDIAAALEVNVNRLSNENQFLKDTNEYQTKRIQRYRDEIEIIKDFTKDLICDFAGAR